MHHYISESLRVLHLVIMGCSAACYSAGHSLPDLHMHHHICESVRVTHLVIIGCFALVALLVIASLTCSSICQVSESAHSVTEHHLVELLPCKSRRCFVLCCLLPRDVISQVELHKYNQVWSLHVWLVIKIKIETALQCCCPVFCCLLPSRSYPA